MIMYCKYCGRYIANAAFCDFCGQAVNAPPYAQPHVAPNQPNRSYELDREDYEEAPSKASMGVLMAFFLGLIGLIIGICLYKEGSYERKTFIKGWLITFFIAFAIEIILVVAFLGHIASTPIFY